MGAPAADITTLLGRMGDGVAGAREALLPVVYRELEAIARSSPRGSRATTYRLPAR